MLKRMMRVALAAALVLMIAGAVPASAKAGDVIRTGACSGSSDWKLKLSPERVVVTVETTVRTPRQAASSEGRSRTSPTTVSTPSARRRSTGAEGPPRRRFVSLRADPGSS